MSRGRRYDQEPKLNIKKVLAVIVAIAVIIMFIYILTDIFTSKEKNSSKITSKSYFSIYKDDKWGVMDSEGNIVIDPSYKEMLIIPDEKTDVFLCTYDVDYNTGTYKTKALNSKNEEIFTQYENIEALTNKGTNDLWYEQNVLRVQKDGKFGTIDFKGKELLKIEYEEITPILEIKNALKIKQNGKYGIADDEGKIIIEPQYIEISQLGEDNKSGYIVKDDSGKYGIIDYSAKVILPCQYEGISKVYGNDLYVILQSGKQVLINKEGQEILKTGFDEITEILKSQDNGVIFKQKDKYGVMKTTGEVIIQPTYDKLKETKTGIFICKQQDKYSVIDIQGNKKIESMYNNITYQDTADIYIAEKENYESDIIDNTFEVKKSGMLLDFNTEKGYMKILKDNNTQYYTFKFEEKNEKEIFPNRTLFISKQEGKYGFVNKDGEVIVDYQYDDATEQNDYGFAGIKKDGKWGSIDANGKVVQEPTYDLEHYLLVNFIGRWHLGEDIYMNYYNQM